MGPTADSTLAGLEQTIADLGRELAERTAERDEALARETATAEVLGVINASAGDLAPVFKAILEKALRICGAAAGNLLSYDGEFFHVEAAMHADGRIAKKQLDRPPLLARSDRHNLLHPLLEGKDFAFSEDVRESNGYRQDPAFREMVDSGGYLSLLNVALRKEGAPREHRHLPRRSSALHRQANRTAAELRRAGSHRDGECAADYRDARGVGAADRDCRDIAGHQFLTR